MGCDYYIETGLVIEFVDMNGSLSKTTTNRRINRRYISSIPEDDSDDDFETRNKKFEKEMEKQLVGNTYKKMLYENDEWVKLSYKKRYLKDLIVLCPTLVKLKRIYKDNIAFSSV